MRTITVLYISTFYPTIDEPFRGHYVEEQANQLVHDLKTDLVIIKPIFNNSIIIPSIKSEIVNENKVISLQIPNYFGINSTYYMISIFKVRIFNLLNNYLNDYNISLIISNDFWGSLKIGNILNEKLKAIHFNIIHGESINESSPDFIKNKVSQQLNKCHSIFAVSNKTKNAIENLLMTKKEILVNGNGLNKKIINHYEHFDFKKSECLTVVSIGNLNYNKGFDIVLQALKDVKKSFHYIIVGDGPYKTELIELCQKLGLSDKVTFTGNVPNQEVYKILEKSHYFIQPSRNEAFGIVYLEGMITENIVIGTKGEGCEDFITDGENGFLVSNPGEIIGILNASHEEFYEQMVFNGKKTAINYNWKVNVEKLISVYHKELKERT